MLSLIRPPNRYDGHVKYLTHDCPACPYFAAGRNTQKLKALHRFPRGIMPNDDALFCVWGKALKQLIEHLKGTMKFCGHQLKPSPVGEPHWMEPEISEEEETPDPVLPCPHGSVREAGSFLAAGYAASDHP